MFWGYHHVRKHPYIYNYYIYTLFPANLIQSLKNVKKRTHKTKTMPQICQSFPTAHLHRLWHSRPLLTREGPQGPQDPAVLSLHSTLPTALFGWKSIVTPLPIGSLYGDISIYTWKTRLKQIHHHLWIPWIWWRHIPYVGGRNVEQTCQSFNM